MADYRVYCLDGSGSISLAEWIQADGDEQAIATARQMTNGALECEVWQGPRLVSKWLLGAGRTAHLGGGDQGSPGLGSGGGGK